MPIDYSKWKKIDISDDEDDTHPNIDTPSLFKWRHEARLQRMAEKNLKKEEVEKGLKTSSKKMKELEDKLAAASTDDEKQAIQKEIETLKADEERYHKLEAELAEQEKNEAWNVDTIGKVTSSTTRINKIADKKPEPKKTSEEEESNKMTEFFHKYETQIETFGRLHGFKQSEEYLLEHNYLVTDYTSSYLTLTALNLAIEGDSRKEEMAIMAEQCTLMQYLVELATTLKLDGTNTGVIKNFFAKFAKADPGYMKHFQDDIDAFKHRLQIRAKQKREEALAQETEAAKKERIAAAPGGLDPQEVFESLPEEMQNCFLHHDIPMLHKVAETMDKEVFQYHFKRCIDSGLWVPHKDDGAEEGAEADETGPSSSKNDTTSE